MEDFNLEQFGEALSNEELRGQILESVANSDAGKDYLSKYAKNHWDQNIGTEVGSIHGKYDEDLRSLGFEKPNGVKTYDYVKQVISELKDKASAADPTAMEELQRVNAELQSKIDNNESAKHFKELYEKAVQDAKAQLEEKDGMIADFQNKQRLAKIEGVLNKALSGLSLKEDLPQDLKETYIKTVYDALLKDAKTLEDGSIAFYGDGELLTNKKTMEKMSAKEILNDRLKSIIAEKASTTGGGGQDGTITKKPSNVTFSNAKSKLELQSLVEDSLLRDGLAKGSAEFTAKHDELLAEYGRELPLR